MICCECEKEIVVGKRPDGLPYGVGFETSNNEIVYVCTDCLMLVGDGGAVHGVKTLVNMCEKMADKSPLGYNPYQE